jgi:opacity protein-like surface antigen
MKKVFKVSVVAFTILFFLTPFVSQGQALIEVSPFAGYMFGGSLKLYEGKLKAENAANYGVAVDFKIARDMQIELMWTQMNTEAQFNTYYGYDNLATRKFDLNVGYIQIGSVREMDFDKVHPFAVVSLGTTYFIPSNVTYLDGTTTDVDDEWKFSMTLGAGAKIWITDKVGIRLQGNLMLPMFWGGAGFTVGTGGAGFTLGAGTSMVQGSFTGGLIFALNKPAR